MMVVQWKVRPFWCREFMINCWRSIECRLKGATVLLIDFIRWYIILIKYADIEIESIRMITINHYFSFHRKSSSSPLFFCVIWLTIIRKWFFPLWLNWSEDSMPSDFFYRLPRFNSPIQIFLIRRQSGFCFYWLRSRAVRMKIIARSSVRRFFFAPSLLSLMIPRLLFLQIRFFQHHAPLNAAPLFPMSLFSCWMGIPARSLRRSEISVSVPVFTPAYWQACSLFFRWSFFQRATTFVTSSISNHIDNSYIKD